MDNNKETIKELKEKLFLKKQHGLYKMTDEQLADCDSFCENYKKYGMNEDKLPFDQHELLALIAPRPLYVASASLDRWADPKGEMLSLTHAVPVYKLYGYEGITSYELPEVNSPVRSDIMGYHLREGKHRIELYDWQQYVIFADRFLK